MLPLGMTTFMVLQPPFLSDGNTSMCNAQSPLFEEFHTPSALPSPDFFHALVMVVVAFFCLRVCTMLANMTAPTTVDPTINHAPTTVDPTKINHAPITHCINCIPSEGEDGYIQCYDVDCRGSRFDANGVPHCRSTNPDGCANCTVTNPSKTFHPFGCLEDHYHNMVWCSDCGPSGHGGAIICSRSSCRGSRVDRNDLPHCEKYRMYGNFCANCDPTLDSWRYGGCLFTILPQHMATCTDCQTGGRGDGVTICYRRACTGSYVDADGVPHCAQWKLDGTFCNNCSPDSSEWTQSGCTG